MIWFIKYTNAILSINLYVQWLTIARAMYITLFY